MLLYSKYLLLYSKYLCCFTPFPLFSLLKYIFSLNFCGGKLKQECSPQRVAHVARRTARLRHWFSLASPKRSYRILLPWRHTSHYIYQTNLHKKAWTVLPNWQLNGFPGESEERNSGLKLWPRSRLTGWWDIFTVPPKINLILYFGRLYASVLALPSYCVTCHGSPCWQYFRVSKTVTRKTLIDQ